MYKKKKIRDAWNPARLWLSHTWDLFPTKLLLILHFVVHALLTTTYSYHCPLCIIFYCDNLALEGFWKKKNHFKKEYYSSLLECLYSYKTFQISKYWEIQVSTVKVVELLLFFIIPLFIKTYFILYYFTQ